MTLALRSPDTVGALISVDNAPVDAALTSDFPKYIRGMRRIEDAQITKQVEAEEIMKQYESVCGALTLFSANLLTREFLRRPSLCPYANFS